MNGIQDTLLILMAADTDILDWIVKLRGRVRIAVRIVAGCTAGSMGQGVVFTGLVVEAFHGVRINERMVCSSRRLYDIPIVAGVAEIGDRIAGGLSGGPGPEMRAFDIVGGVTEATGSD